MGRFSKEYLEKTIKVWQPYSPEPLTLEDAEEIAANMTDLFAFLFELRRKRYEKEKNLQPQSHKD